MIDHEIQTVVRMKDDEGLSFREIAQTLHFSERTARRRYAASTVTTTQTLVETSDGDDVVEIFPDVDDLAMPSIGTRLGTDGYGPINRFKPYIVGGDAVVISDIHIPLHRPDLLNKMFASAEGRFDTLIINGDFWHMETFGSFMPKQLEASLPKERLDGNVAMKTMLQVFDRIFMTCGNHDFRLVRKTGHTQSYEDAMDYMFYSLDDDEKSRLNISSLDYLWYYPETNISSYGLNTDGGRTYRVCHQDNFSTVPLSVPRALAHRYNCSIITGHSHHLAMGFCQDGYNIAIENGGFFDPNRTEYVQKTRKGHVWTPGWVEFVDGVPELKSELLGNV